MAQAKFCKVVGSLPGTLEGNTLYAVRVGTGFDLYLTTDPTLGTVLAKKINDPLVGLPYDYSYAAGDEGTDLTTGQKISFGFPRSINITGVFATLNTASSSGTVTVDIKKNGSTIFSTKITFVSGVITTIGAATPAVLSVTTIAAGDVITTHVDGAGTGADGLKLTILGTLS